MDMNLRQVRAFVVAARFGSFTRAAGLLNLTQPALTVQIRQLEQTLGVRLFDRNTRSVELTRIGRDLLPALERLLGELDGVVASARKMAAVQSGSVAIAALPSVAATVLPPVVAEFGAAHPEIRVTVLDGVGRRINALVQEEAVDFGIGADIEPEAGLDSVPLFGDELLAVLPAGHPLCVGGSVTLEQLAEQPLILTNPESTVRYLANRAFAARNLLLTPAYEVTYMSTAVGMVRAGLGVALLPSTAIELSMATAVALLPVGAEGVKRSIALVLKSGRTASPAAQAFRDLLMARRPGGGDAVEISGSAGTRP